MTENMTTPSAVQKSWLLAEASFGVACVDAVDHHQAEAVDRVTRGSKSGSANSAKKRMARRQVMTSPASQAP